jgi:hypothetical protein
MATMATIQEQAMWGYQGHVNKHDPVIATTAVDAMAKRAVAEGLLHMWLEQYQAKHSCSLSKAYDAAMQDRKARGWWDQCRAADVSIAEAAAASVGKQTDVPVSVTKARLPTEFETAVNDHHARNPHLTRSQAQDEVLRTQAGKAAFQRSNGNVSKAVPPSRASDITDDVRAKLAHRYDASNKFKAAVIALMQAVPGMTRSKASDRVRIEQPALWEAMRT